MIYGTSLEVPGIVPWCILSQAVEIVFHQKPPNGVYPMSVYHNSKTIEEPDNCQGPNLLGLTPQMAKSMNYFESNSEYKCSLDPTDSLEDFDGSFVKPSQDTAIRRAIRVHNVAHTVYTMVAFVFNHGHNGFQLADSLIFLTSGVTERVSTYLNYVSSDYKT
ncbi:uncharacterized protein VP01_1118g3 [Puccinia sorghi]|uniref:Uncharacterized protein n=1 Tax=Puccinia sorghi TaxID=27349 RepID=A0A0L6VSF1_9BASI|nr:uncharacterized protein VP01_1118g3 [Puccinia sorghi]